jgi:hypothetical protein
VRKIQTDKSKPDTEAVSLLASHQIYSTHKEKHGQANSGESHIPDAVHPATSVSQLLDGFAQLIIELINLGKPQRKADEKYITCHSGEKTEQKQDNPCNRHNTTSLVMN